jgi:hypothetical protein
MLPTAAYLCGIEELIGWSGRLWSSFSPRLGDLYIMPYVQVCSPSNAVSCIVPSGSPKPSSRQRLSSPSTLVNFILLSRIITRLGPAYSRLTPKSYTHIFFACVGPSPLYIVNCRLSAASSHESQQVGGNIIFAGIVFQFIAIMICVYTALSTNFLY